MKQKGFVLIELVLIMLLSGIVATAAFVGFKMVEEARFECAVTKVMHQIEVAKQSAVLTGEQYNVISFDHRIFLTHGGYQISKIDLGDSMRIPNDITGHFIKFKDSFAPQKAGTILIMDQILGKQARITVGVGTGMVRVYYEPCRKDSL